MTMSRKDYVKFAEIIKESRPFIAWNQPDQEFHEKVLIDNKLNEVARQLSNYFEVDNHRFDRDKFLFAAGTS